jgi:Na+-driven multidrug efflux pump
MQQRLAPGAQLRGAVTRHGAARHARCGGVAAAASVAAARSHGAASARERRNAPAPTAAVAGLHAPVAVGAHARVLRVNACRGTRARALSSSSSDAAAAVSPAADIVADSAADAAVVGSAARVPSMRELLAFALPSMGIWLASPLLSLVDVAVVGQASTLELASLAPATGLCDSAAYSFTFLAVATTSLIARARARGDTAAAQGALSDALTIAAVCGTALCVFLLLGAPTLLAAYSGAASAAVVGPAITYTRIRALGMPAALLVTVSQAAFLAAKLPGMPLLTVAIASVVNLAGDLLLCCVLHYGVAGAAWATIASQFVAAAVIVSRLRLPTSPGQPPLLGSSAVALWPRNAAVVRMLRVGGPVCLLILLKVLLIAVGLGGAATQLSPTSAAVHAVMMTVCACAASVCMHVRLAT